MWTNILKKLTLIWLISPKPHWDCVMSYFLLVSEDVLRLYSFQMQNSARSYGLIECCEYLNSMNKCKIILECNRVQILWA
jgi:hypothetical protein